MLNFEDNGTELLLVYSGFPEWIDTALNNTGRVRISKVFNFRTDHLISPGSDEDHRRFVIATRSEDYWIVEREILGLRHDLKISTSIRITKSTFVAYQGISIFRRIDQLINESIVIGGDMSGAVPAESFQYLLRHFPNTTEVQHYASARVSRVLSEYFDTMTDAERQLAKHLKDRKKRDPLGDVGRSVRRFTPAHELDLDKFSFLRAEMAHMLDESESYSEGDWQKHVASLFTLIFPQYITVLEEVKVKDYYSREDRVTNRFIDLAVVAANGNLDILEIKKPNVGRIVSTHLYRDNHIPLRELSGTIMQVEKYLFYLNKSGHIGEREITDQYRHLLPQNLKIKITNPKAMILFGRDNELSPRELSDFEFTRRKYSNIVDIMTYDDLLRRLDALIGSLKVKKTLDL